MRQHSLFSWQTAQLGFAAGLSSARARVCRRVKAGGAAVMAACLGLALAACGGGAGSVTPTPIAANASASPAAVPAGLERFYSQKLEWHRCGTGDSIAESADGDFECSSIEVPLDYSQPGGQAIRVALKKRAASGEKIGTLFINPGGPGGSGVELVDHVKGYFSDALLASYDVVGFDPRGVGASTAVDCYTDAQLDAERAAAGQEPLADLDEEAAQAQVRKDAEDFEAACQARTSTAGLLEHIDTVSAAKDLDVMRALVGERQLTYLGYSYGTYLGATYADLFPSNVGRFVLDGAIDPTLSAASVTLGQAKAFEAALRSFVADCQTGKDCPLTGGVDGGVKQIRELLARAASDPIPTSTPSRPLTYALAESAILGVLYQDESWSVLSEALQQAMVQNDGSSLLYIADVFASRNSDGTYSGNGDEVLAAINCLDYPVEGDATTWAEQAEELRKVSPTFGADLAYPDLLCQARGAHSTREHTAIKAAGAAPILVVGTTGDPATPYTWSKALASQLESARLLTWKGEGHTAYGRAGSCVTNAVDAYLLAGTLPKEGLTCEGRK